MSYLGNKRNILHYMQLFPKCTSSFVQLSLLMSHRAQAILDWGCKHMVTESEGCVTDIRSLKIRRQSTNKLFQQLCGFFFFWCALTTQQNVTVCWYPACGVVHISSYAESSHCTDEHMCSFYSRIPLIWHARDWTGAGL